MENVGLKIFQKARLGNLELPNRLIVPPMEVFLADAKGFITDAYIKYAEKRAEGGFGLFIVEASYVELAGKGFSHGIGIDDDDKIPGLCKLTDAIHAKGGKISIQLHHAGRETSSSVTGSAIQAPSDTPVCYSDEAVHVLTRLEIKAIVQKFTEAAIRAKRSGFDAIMLHGAHGYLLNQFLSPYTNKRTDEYGGSLENRLRISLEIIEAIRKNLGPDFPITYRLSVEEGLPGGLQLQEGCVSAAMLSKAGIDAIHVVAGNYGSNELIIPPYFAGKVTNRARLQAVRNAVGPDFPLTAAGRITNVFEAEELVQDGLAQFVAMGRASLADPELPKRSLAGRFNTVRTCIGCNDGCVGRTSRNLPASCAINPMTGHESEYALEKLPGKPKKILVIGAGPAGMEAAWLAARAGHKVILCEKGNQIGGQFLLAALPPEKSGIFTYLSHMSNRLLQENVELRLNCPVTSESLEQEKPDFVFLATGGQPLKIPFPGIETIHYETAQAVLKDRLAKLGERVAVIGGGMVGLETAEYIASTGRQVEVIEMLPEVAQDLFFTVRNHLLQKLQQASVNIHAGCKVERIENGIIFCAANGHTVKIGPVDSVVLALGVRPENNLKILLEEKNIPFEAIGDCARQGNCFQATHMALKACEI